MNFLYCYSILLFCTVCFLISGCTLSPNHFLKDETYRQTVHQHFLERKELALGRDIELFSVFNKPDLTTEQREALEFLYAYMPLSDLADYDGNYFLGQVDAAFKARDYFDWGKKIPDDIFRHFVLVHRIKNEHIDTARQVFFEELKDRVKGLSMEEAALEVNHWCHEKVTYRGSDGRTSAPLALAKTSWGRCGEEAAFTAVALRSVGIPARQCHTPRWVHTDDNHAWVEAWIDGKWHYMGACEPEAELNTAWFSIPVKRTMLVLTNVYGVYNGSEEKVAQTDLYSIINLLPNYTDTRTLKVNVVNENNEPVKDATVKFNVYNYAEFYPIATLKTDSTGVSSLITGMGDILVMANKGNLYGHLKSTPTDNSITVTIKEASGDSFEETILMGVPTEQPTKDVAADKMDENAKRLVHEDSIRNAYMNTFAKEADSRVFAAENNLNADKTWNYLSRAHGNWTEIQAFLKAHKENKYLYSFLESLTDKDLRDTPADYLADHISAANNRENIIQDDKSNTYARYILSPRISNELIRPWRSFFKKELTEEFIAKSKNDIRFLIDYVYDNIKVDNIQNYYGCPISPQGVYQLKMANSSSRNIFFVALCRSIGIPSRIDPATSRPQYLKAESNKWIDVFFSKQTKEKPQGEITFSNNTDNIIPPKYSTHYSLARFDNGGFSTLAYRNQVKKLPATVSLDAGYYRLMAGSRINNGSVIVDTKYFTIKENESQKQEIKLPKVERGLQVQGTLDPNTIIKLDNGESKTIKELTNKKGLIICFADPDKEPTKHILQDLPAVRQLLEEWNGGMLFAVPDDKVSKAFDVLSFRGLPRQSEWMTDNNRALLNRVAGALQINFSNNFPLMIYLSTNGGILYSSQGYRIGIGEDILRTIKEEKNR